jgi:uncharacterized membrane protein YqjE
MTDGAGASTEPKRADASLGELVSELTAELSTLFRQEVQLAKVEVRRDAANAGRAGGMLGGAGVAAWLGALMASLALAWLLDQAMNRAVAFLIVAVLWAIAAAALFVAGRNQLRSVRGAPQTRETIKEDIEWAKAKKS